MEYTLWIKGLLLSALLVSCASEPNPWTVVSPDPTEINRITEVYVIEDYKGKAEGQDIPQWVNNYLEAGIQGIEAMDIYQFHHVFVSRNVGSSFDALMLWADGFSPELDFPRMAASRIESRFFLEAPLPDREFGSFFIDLIRTVSDAEWTGTSKEDDFWMLKRDVEDESISWEFLVVASISKTSFASQFLAIYNSINSRPPPSWEQLRAISRIRDRFFEGF